MSPKPTRFSFNETVKTQAHWGQEMAGESWSSLAKTENYQKLLERPGINQLWGNMDWIFWF